ncbi:MAG: HAMP domain-containing sensor histidine kinase, partial [Elainellaceae cyanobacterium]
FQPRPSWTAVEPPPSLDFPMHSMGHDGHSDLEGDRQQMPSSRLPLSAGYLDPNAEAARQDQARVENAKNVFLATVNHELRTPLTYILGMSTTLLRWIDDGATAALHSQQRHYLESIYNQGKHLLDLINNILDLSQSELGQIALNVQPVSLLRLVQRCIRACQADAAQRGIMVTLETQIDPAQDKIVADPLRLQQIVTGLLNNAIKFTPADGRVTVRLALSDTEATIEVQDTGIGIAEHHQATIFQKFKQIDESYHRQYAGIGTGLALVKQLTELHHGQIEVDSTPDIGTLFTVRLPHTLDGITPVSGALWPRSVGCSGERVVLIDDQSEAAAAAADGIIAAGYQLIWMVEGQHVVERITKLRPHCVIVGSCLTGIDSRELMYQLRQNSACEHLRLIAIDDGRKAVEIESRHQYENLGVAKVCTTPIDLTGLLDSLDGG